MSTIKVSRLFFRETFGNCDFFVFEDEYFTVKKQQSKCVCVRVSFMFFIFCVSAFPSAFYIIMLSSLDNFNILDVQYDDAIIVFIQKKCVQYPSIQDDFTADDCETV